MNKQRKVLITITYNEMGIIVDTKAEEVAQPSAKDTNVPITDTISRQAALDALRYAELGCEFEVIEQLPSAQQWIPCSERLPGKYEYVLLTCERNGKIAVDFGCISPDIDGDLSWWIAANDSIEGWRVLAWCPLPEPWKGEHV